MVIGAGSYAGQHLAIAAEHNPQGVSRFVAVVPRAFPYARRTTVCFDCCHRFLHRLNDGPKMHVLAQQSKQKVVKGKVHHAMRKDTARIVKALETGGGSGWG